MKKSRRLERHFVRGLRKVSLHAAMLALGFTATFLVKATGGGGQTPMDGPAGGVVKGVEVQGKCPVKCSAKMSLG